MTFQTPHQLGIPEDQHAALVKTLELMEAGKIVHVDEYTDCVIGEFTGHFNMDVWIGRADCGTVACIGGTAELVGKVKFNSCGIPKALDDLFYKYGNGNPTVADGAKALRNYLTDGDAKWDEVMG
jgi:hypothetical protein